MKKGILAIVAVILGAMVIPALAGTTAGTGVIASMHDITAYSKLPGNTGVKGDNEGRVCVFCHTPHHASTDSTLDYNPLWNHAVTTQVYQPYESATFSYAAAGGGADPLTGPSRLCMSCHDGSVALDQHGGTDSQAGGTMLSGNKVVGSTTHSTDHPIGFSFTTAQAAHSASINPASTTWSGGTGTVAAALHNGDTMTCATCHDVHNKVNAVNAPGADSTVKNYLVRSPQAGSALCLTCHNT